MYLLYKTSENLTGTSIFSVFTWVSGDMSVVRPIDELSVSLYQSTFQAKLLLSATQSYLTPNVRDAL